MTTEAQEHANDELAKLMARFSQDVREDVFRPEGMMTAIKDGERQIMVAFDFGRTPTTNPAMRTLAKQATWTIMGGLLAWADAVACLFDGFARELEDDVVDDEYRVVIGMGLVLDGDRLAVNPIVVPYRPAEGGQGNVIGEPITPDDNLIDAALEAGLADGIARGPLEPDLAALMAVRIGHAAHTQRGCIGVDVSVEDLQRTVNEVLFDGQDPTSN